MVGFRSKNKWKQLHCRFTEFHCFNEGYNVHSTQIFLCVEWSHISYLICFKFYTTKDRIIFFNSIISRMIFFITSYFSQWGLNVFKKFLIKEYLNSLRFMWTLLNMWKIIKYLLTFGILFDFLQCLNVILFPHSIFWIWP